MTREGKEVLGKSGSNLWILTLVLVATFSSIAFSDGSMTYLRDKMADPFTNWVSINKDVSNEAFNSFRDQLMRPEIADSFDYRDVLMDQYLGLNIQGPNNGRVQYLSIRFFEHLHTPIVSTILNKKNVIEGCKVDSAILIDNTLGVIITLDAINKKLGINKDIIPPYVYFLSSIKPEHAYDIDIDSLGLKPLAINNVPKFVPIALPILAVVYKLPNNVDMISSDFFYKQYHVEDCKKPFDVVTHELDYLHHLIYWVSDEVGLDEFSQFVKQNGKGVSVFDESSKYLSMKPWKSGKMVVVDVGGETQPIEVFNEMDKAVSNRWDANQVQRVYKLDTDESIRAPRSDYLSVEFRSLKHIREFEDFAKHGKYDNGEKEYNISIEMEKVHSMENFNAVTVMARILSAAMVVFSIICIIMFLVNMLQSYFQKVKRNLGTFKAFGMNTCELTMVYIIIIISIVFFAVIMALLITWAIQGLLPVLGIVKEGFNYLSLWNITTYVAIGVILASTILTVIVVMSRMLSQTPGDLIYDRN